MVSSTASPTGMTLYQQMGDPVNAVVVIGTAIAKSRLFGCETVEQGQVLALECMVRGMPPLTLAEKYHLIQGKLSMRADAMLAEFNARGGKHKIKERSPERVAITLILDGESQDFSFSWEEALLESFVYSKVKGPDGQLLLKDNYATPRRRMQMLWARVVSDAVRAIMPGVNQGRYTPEDLEAEASVPCEAPAETKKRSTRVPKVDVTVKEEKPLPVSKPPFEEVEEAEVFVGTTPSPEVIQGAQEAALMAELGQEAKPKTETKASVHAPCSDGQEHEIRELLKRLNQEKPGSIARFKQVLADHGKQRIAELTVKQADSIIQQLSVKNIEAFFEKGSGIFEGDVGK